MDSDNAIVRSDVEELRAVIARLPTQGIDIASNDDFVSIAQSLQVVKGDLKIVEDMEEREKRPHLDALTKIREEYRPAREQLKKVEASMKFKLEAWEKKQEELRLRKQEEANEAARKEAERLHKQAQKAFESGKPEKATEILTRAESVVAPAIEREAPKVSGLVFHDVWMFEVINKKDVPEQYKVVDNGLLRKVVSAMKGETRITGVRVWCEKKSASGSKTP